jgi:hypothetical protein
MYVTTQQERQLLAVASFREFPTNHDLMPDQVVDEAWFEQAQDWDETTLAASLWFDHINGGLSS